MISRKFIKSSFIYTVAGTLPVANAVLLLPLYLHYLPAEEFGALAFYLSFAILVQVLVTYSFDASLYLYFHEYKNDPKKLSIFVSSAFNFVMILGAIVGLALLAIGTMLFNHFFSAQGVTFLPYGLFSVITAIFQSVFKVNNALLQSSEKPQLFLWSNLFSFVLVTAFTILGLVLFPNSLAGPIAGKMIAFGISGLWVLQRIYRQYGMHFSIPVLRTSFSYNNYQLIYQIQQWVINYFDRPLMAILITMVDLGVYDFTLKCLIIIDLLISGLVNSFLPKVLSQTIGKKYESMTPEINRYYNGLTGAIMIMVSGSILVFPVLINILIAMFVKKPGYDAAVYLVPFASLVFLLRGMRYYFGLPYSIMKYNKPFPFIFLIVSASKVAFSVLLIQRYAIYGAIGATVLCSGLEIILVWWWMKDKFRYQFNIYKILVAPLGLMAIILTLEPWLGMTYPIAIHSLYVVLTAASLFWIYRNELPLLDLKKIIKG